MEIYFDESVNDIVLDPRIVSTESTLLNTLENALNRAE